MTTTALSVSTKRCDICDAQLTTEFEIKKERCWVCRRLAASVAREATAPPEE